MRRLGLVVLALVGCSGPTQAVAPPDASTHLGEDWFVFRAADLGISVDEARRRDAALSEVEPPESDPTLATEAAALWTNLCARCHGVDGRGVDELDLRPEPKKWGGFGVRMGFFFGGDKMRAGIYRQIRDGPDREGPSAMPAWGEALSREQIWALVGHIEGF